MAAAGGMARRRLAHLTRQAVVEGGLIRIVDLVFIKKDADGNVAAFEIDAVEEAGDLGLDDLDGEAGTLLSDEDFSSRPRRWSRTALRPCSCGSSCGRSGSSTPSGTRVGSWWPASASRPTWSRPSERRCREERTVLLRPGMRMGRPGLIGMAARTVDVAGTATAVSGRAARRQQARHEDKAQAEAYQDVQQPAAQAPPPPPAPAPAGEDAVITQLQQLADLKNQGVLNEAEFEAQKARILGG